MRYVILWAASLLVFQEPKRVVAGRIDSELAYGWTDGESTSAVDGRLARFFSGFT